jgi:hypothetical protein
MLVISGGLDSNENILDEILVVDLHTFDIKKVELAKGTVYPR